MQQDNYFDLLKLSFSQSFQQPMPMKHQTHQVISKEKQHKIDSKSNNECNLKLKNAKPPNTSNNIKEIPNGMY